MEFKARKTGKQNVLRMENGYIKKGSLLERKIDFPEISNCTGCPFKEESTIAVMAEVQPTKIEWFAEQEKLEKGTWIKDNTYENIIQNRFEIAKEKMFEYQVFGQSCDSGGCTD